MKVFKSLLLALIAFAMMPTIHAQNANHEIGLRMGSLNNFGAIYKKQRSENKYLRIRMAFVNSSIQLSPYQFNAGLGLALGWEKRRAISEGFEFIHGFEPFLQAKYLSQEGNTPNTYSTVAGLGYVLGFQYHFNSQFYVGLETIPALTGRFSFDDNGGTYPSSLGIGFNSNAVSLSLIYKFNKAK